MATETPGFVTTLIAGEDLSAVQYFPVSQEADGEIAVTANDARSDGFLQNTPSAQGQAATVMQSGITKAVVGTGGVTAGVAVKAIAATGVTDVTSAGDWVVGVALDTGVVGVIVRVRITDAQMHA